MADQIFKEMINDAITSKILNGQLNTVLEKNVTKLFQNRKLIEQLMGSGFKNVPPFARGGMGAVYNFGGYVMKETQICQNIQTPVSQELCDIANKNDDIQYETVDTVLDKKKYILPNHILELLCGIYLSHKLRPFTDGFGYCMSGLYDKTRKATYILQERLTPIQAIIPDGFNGLSLSDYLILLYEILMTLAISQDKYKFVHYDLHTGNIMFRDCGVVKKRIYDCIVTINVPNERRSIIIESRYQPVIIDYGFARFETDDVVVSPVVEFKNDGSYYLDNHLYNPYYDIVTLLRSFMTDFRRIITDAVSTAYMRTSATHLYNITICILSYTFGDMPHNLIDSMFLGYPLNLENPRVDINKLCKTQVRGIKDIANRILNIASQARTNVLVGTNGFNIPAVQIPLPPVSNIGYTIDFALPPYRAVQNNGVNDRYYDVRNLNLFSDFKVISAPLNQRIGGINAEFAWQYENYRISRALLGLANDRKRYNLTFTPDGGQQYNDDLHISCAVMWNPSTRTTPFRFSTECCRIDAKRFLQDERIKEGITINGTFFQWTKNFGPVGFFKKDQLTIDDSDINFNYASDYYYILINENGNLSIAPTNVLDAQQPYNIFDETENTSLFTAGPKLVGGGNPLFTDNKIDEVYSDNGVYYLKYWCRQGGQQSYSQAYDDAPQFIADAENIYAQAPPVPENVFIKDINDIRPGDFIHALNPNPRSVIATTNNGLVLFFTFLGRGNFAGPAPDPVGGATGIDLIDLSSILVNPALIAPLNLPAGTIITEAINLDGGGSSSVNIKDAAQPHIITSGQTSASYMVGNIVAYTYK